MISETGLNLNFLINCNYNLFDDWRSFCLYYSINQYAPDSNICINYIYEKNIKNNLFKWYKKPYKFNINKKTIKLNCNYLMIRELKKENIDYLNNNLIINIDKISCSAKEEELFPFVNYENVFNLENYKNKHPFDDSYLFINENINFNELKILQFWEKISRMYNQIIN